MRFELPSYVESAINRLESAGFATYLVGGCLRDLLMGAVPKDYDLTTAATPSQIKAVFWERKTVDTGIRHGTVQVLFDEGAIEITTFRQDGNYADNRHPEQVTFVSSIEDDLRRRDFTMNAIAYTPSVGMVDPHGGRADIASGVIRAVGDPELRFGEDALRIMRALRFSASLGFAIDGHLSECIHAQKDLLHNIAVERLSDELLKLLVGEHVLGVLLEYPDVLGTFIPEIQATVGLDQKTPFHCYDVWEHTAYAVAAGKRDPIVRLTLLMHDMGKPQAFFMGEDGRGHFYGHNKTGEAIVRTRLKALHFPTAIVETVASAVFYHQLSMQPEGAKKWLSRLGEEMLRLVIAVKWADMAAHATDVIARNHSKITEFEAELDRLIAEGKRFTLKDLAANGQDLLDIGVPNGKTIGEVLQFLLDAVLDGTIENSRDDLLQAAEDYVGKV